MAALQPLRGGWDNDREPDGGRRENALAGLFMMWRIPALGWISVAVFWFSIVQLSLVAFLVTMLVEEARFTLLEAGFLLSLLQVAGILGRLICGWVADRLGDGLAVLAVLGLLVAVCALTTSTLSAAWPIVIVHVLFLVFGFVCNGWSGVYMAEVTRLSPPKQVSAATGASVSMSFGGVLAGPAGFAAVYGLLGSYTATFPVLALAGVAAAVAAIFSRMAVRGTNQQPSG